MTPSVHNYLRKPQGVKEEDIRETGKALVLKHQSSIEPRKAGIPNDELEKRISHRLDVINSYLDDETLMGRLANTSLKDITVAEAIQLDKLMALRGQPSIIVGHQTYKKLDELGPALIQELKRRNLKATLTERKAVIETDETDGDFSPARLDSV